MKLKRFDFTAEVIERFKEESILPVNFYNQHGQILINSKEEATVHEINQLLKFQEIGIYYDENDYAKMTGQKEATSRTGEDSVENRAVPRGLTDTKLLSQQTADELSDFTSELFSKLKKETIDSVKARSCNKKLTKIFDDFSEQPDAMVGLINILELMEAKETDLEVELAVKRTVVTMALKTRGMLTQSEDERGRMKAGITTTMMAAMLCDIAFLRMNLPSDRAFRKEEYEMMKRHPLISYLMIASEVALSHEVKHYVLFQHYRKKDKPNNYPHLAVIERELEKRKTKFSDIPEQLHKLRTENIYTHDANLLGIASKFAFLTTGSKRKAAYSAVDAVRAIVNNACFTYSYHSIREFLDYSAISLCDNSEIIKGGDIIVVEAISYSSESAYELCMVIESTRFQSRPLIKRFATIFPEIRRTPKTAFADFKLDSIRPDKRHVDIDLNRDNTREIVYIVDPQYDEKLYKLALSVIGKS